MHLAGDKSSCVCASAEKCRGVDTGRRASGFLASGQPACAGTASTPVLRVDCSVKAGGCGACDLGVCFGPEHSLPGYKLHASVALLE